MSVMRLVAGILLNVATPAERKLGIRSGSHFSRRFKRRKDLRNRVGESVFDDTFDISDYRHARAA